VINTQTKEEQMNKWLKNGMAGLVLGTTALTVATENKTQAQPLKLQSRSVDALDFAGGSKLKDRMIKFEDKSNVTLVRILLDV
jgi:hypothetical protein